jgi:hypothetical protein
MENDPADLFHVWSASFLMEEETDQIRQEEFKNILLEEFFSFTLTSNFQQLLPFYQPL